METNGMSPIIYSTTNPARDPLIDYERKLLFETLSTFVYY